MLARTLLLFCSLLACSVAAPLRHLKKHDRRSEEQQLLRDPAHYTAAHKPKVQQPNTRLDAAPNSVGVLFTTADDEEVSHMWLPLGKRVYTRDAPELPLHPLTARITTMIRSSPQVAAPEYLDRLVCEIHPRYNHTAENPDPEAMFISISRGEGLVRLDDADVMAWREVESYKCS
ncbi:hypothetical protein LTR36_008839 [Oleoguttula mirabilis]|uniref:Uncharacterized protein n=1 Tax=Oleoguttula mirabilis TaxID=1507867 RepID=A0AAV9J758_9PEZI|nr:hypothetical protein LTR36_008839 [Oleoguttula mirabilis]